MKLSEKLLLYVVTDRSWIRSKNLSARVEETIKAGATFIQLREKDLDIVTFVAEAFNIKRITDKYKVPFVINDNIDVCNTVDADGIHIGQDDMDAETARKLIGENKILGVSVQTVEQAISAEKAGADYLGVGAVFPTSTKSDAETVSLNVIKDICQSVSIPVVAIGGINEGNADKLAGTGVCGIAVISAIFAKPDISVATKELYRIAKEVLQ